MNGSRRRQVRGAGGPVGATAHPDNATLPLSDLDPFEIEIVRSRSRTRFRWFDYIIFAILTGVQLGVLGLALHGWFTSTAWSVATVPVVVLAATILVQVVLWELRWFALPFMRVPLERPAPDGRCVGIAITFVPGAESLDMLERTVGAATGVLYPHETWVLDEGGDPEVRELCRRYGASYFTRSGIGRYQQESGPFRARTRYGNYNAWLEEFGYDRFEFVVAVDSDHVLRPDYLDRVLGFFDDPDVAFVQPAESHFNHRASLVARGAAEEECDCQSLLMVAHGFDCQPVIACHNTHRLAALRDTGGFSAHEADDTAMTLRYHTDGWRGVAVPRILARGLAPANWGEYLSLHRKRVRAALDFALRVLPRHARHLPLFHRVAGRMHAVYAARGILIPVQIAALVAALATGGLPYAGDGAWLLRDAAFLVAATTLCNTFRQRFLLHASDLGIRWRSRLLALARWPWTLLGVIDAAGGSFDDRIVTPKNGGSHTPRAFVATHATVAALVAIALAIGMLDGPIRFLPLTLGAVFTLSTALLTAGLASRRPVPAWDPLQAGTWRARHTEPRQPSSQSASQPVTPARSPSPTPV